MFCWYKAKDCVSQTLTTMGKREHKPASKQRLGILPGSLNNGDPAWRDHRKMREEHR